MRNTWLWQRWLQLLALLFAVGMFAVIQPAVAAGSGPKRLALVIGNDNYKNVTLLTNARNDARLFASVLKRAGFDVTTVNDVSRDGFWTAVDTFKNRINKGDEVVFYYAGHGVQIASNQLLLPVDIKAQSDAQVQRDGVSLVDVQDALKDARFAMFVIDACRDNPFPKQGTRSIGTTRGLLPPEPATGQVIIMSAGRNQKALDSVPGVKADNGLFTYELAQVLQQPGVEIRTALETVKETVDDVAKKVNHEQRPSLVNDLRGNFYFFGTTTVQVARPLDEPDPETQTWIAATTANTESSFNAYLKSFPNGKYESAARIRLESLSKNGLVFDTGNKLGGAQHSTGMEIKPNEAQQNDLKVTVGIITKTNTNPFFKKMRQGAEDAARNLGVYLLAASGNSDGDTNGQIEAIENMVLAGAKTILITSSGDAIIATVKKHQARGVQFIALDSPFNGADALFGTDNYGAGISIGKYAAGSLGGKKPVIATLDLFPGHPVGAQRHNGFLHGIGLNSFDARNNELAMPPSVVCHGDTFGDMTKGREVMERCIRASPDINVVYALNEPAAAGAYQALRAAGSENQALIVSVDGGCEGIRNIRGGYLAATSQQYPYKMGYSGVEAGLQYARDGRRSRGYTNTGASLITDKPVSGLESRDTSVGYELCWGNK